MSSTLNIAASRHARPLPAAVTRLIEEVIAFLSVIASPRRVIEEVEAMAALHRRAAQLDSTDPAQAARLREKAARIGLR